MYNDNYRDNFPNEYPHGKESENQNKDTALNTAGGRFSSQTSQDTYHNDSYGAAGSRTDSYYGANRNYGYGGSAGYQNTNQSSVQGAEQNTGYGQSTGSYQYSNVYSGNYAQAEKKKTKKEKKGGGYFKKALVCISLGLFFGICAGIGLYVVDAATGLSDKNGTAQTKAEEQADQDVEEIEAGSEEVLSDSLVHSADGADIEKTQTVYAVVSDVSDVVSAVMPAVVSISNTYTETLSYFGQAMTNEAVASGSGIIVGENDSELLIVTNYHVIQDADMLKVQFVEGSEAEAAIKGTDAEMDLAVISVSIADIPASALEQIAVATLGDSDGLKVGEPAIAIGNSLGYGQSVTTGVISALNRDMELSDGSTGTFIQTDAAINPGNSGGALLNINGEVIGINSNKIGGSVVEGMGYAIPISAASPIIADLMLRETKNKVTEEERGFLGISGISVTAQVSSTYGMPEGVYIAQVYDGTAAAAAGLQKGDIITAFGGDKVTSMDELQRLLEYYAKGETVEVTVMTIGNGGYEEKTVSLTLGNRVEQ